MSWRTGLCAVVVLSAFSAQGSLITSAGKASTSNKGKVSTTTTGQKQILAGIDPFGTVSFQLDYSFQFHDAALVSLYGVNGYVVTGFGPITYNHTTGIAVINDIFGFYDPYGTVVTAGETPPLPPLGEVDIFEILFDDLNPNVTKQFLVFAGDPNDFIQGIDPQGNFLPPATGPSNISSALLVVPANAPNGPVNQAVPLPAAWVAGLVMGGAAFGWRMRVR